MKDMEVYSRTSVLDRVRLGDLTRDGLASLFGDVGLLDAPTRPTSPVRLVETATGDRVVDYPFGLEPGEEPIRPWA